MDTDAAAGLEASYLEASARVAHQAAILGGKLAQGAPVSTAVATLSRLAGELAADGQDVAWRRLWLLETDARRLGSTRIGWVPHRGLRSVPTATLLGRVEERRVREELAVRALTDPAQGGAALEALGGARLRDLLVESGPGGLRSLGILLAAASRSEAGLDPEMLAALLPSDATHAPARIAAFGQMLGQGTFSDEVAGAALAWATDPRNLPHLEMAMSKFSVAFAAVAVAAVAASGTAAALFLTGADSARALRGFGDPTAAFHLDVDGDDAAASLIRAVSAAAADGTLDPAVGFDIWLSLADDLQEESLPGNQSRVALGEFTNLYWDEIPLLSVDVTRPIFGEIAFDETALATVSVELGNRTVPLVTSAAADLHAGRDVSAHVEVVVNGYAHVFGGIQDQRSRGDGGLVSSALDAVVSTAAAPTGPAGNWLARNLSPIIIDQIVVADRPQNIRSPRDFFEHQFSPSGTAVPGGFYPPVSGFQRQVLSEVLRVGSTGVDLPQLPDEEFAEWFARTTAGTGEVARDYHELRSEFADRVLLQVLEVETD